MDAVQSWVRDFYIPRMMGAERAVRLDATDGREVRHEAADDFFRGGRNHVDDELTQARLDFEERIATAHLGAAPAGRR
jgi:hypothetical protein